MQFIKRRITHFSFIMYFADVLLDEASGYIITFNYSDSVDLNNVHEEYSELK
jgi:hypothetical protein